MCDPDWSVYDELEKGEGLTHKLSQGVITANYNSTAAFKLILYDMSTEEEFFIKYQNKQIKVSTVLDGAKIYFCVHLPKPVVIAEQAEGDEWVWYNIHTGETELATELGALIEEADQ